MSMPDGAIAALRQHEAERDRRDRSRAMAEAKSEQLVDDWLQDHDAASVEELIAQLMARDPQMLTMLRRLLAATAKGRNLSNELNRDAVIVPAVAMCSLIRNEVDRVHGDDLIERAADALDEPPCRCRGDCTC